MIDKNTLIDSMKMSQFILDLGYDFTYGDNYFMVELGDWSFQSDILSECQLEALKHSTFRDEVTLCWTQKLKEIVKTFREHNTNLVNSGAVEIILKKLKEDKQ